MSEPLGLASSHQTIRADRLSPRGLQPLPIESVPAKTQEVRLDARWAKTDAEVALAQKLRYQVFVEEMGARLIPPKGTPEGLDADVFDPYCEHLLVFAHVADADEPLLVGTYRVLTFDASRRTGGFYSDTEFDLTRLRPLRPRMLELGRSCVHPDWRHGGTIMTLWAALAAFMQSNGLDVMVGCASVSMRDGGHMAASLWNQLRQTHLAPIEWQVRPRLALPVDDLRQDLPVQPPALIKGYLRCGAKVLGPPAWDPDFNTADLPLLMRLEDLPARYRRHFMGTPLQA
jgi:putative hemolysin